MTTIEPNIERTELSKTENKHINICSLMALLVVISSHSYVIYVGRFDTFFKDGVIKGVFGILLVGTITSIIVFFVSNLVFYYLSILFFKSKITAEKQVAKDAEDETRDKIRRVAKELRVAEKLRVAKELRVAEELRRSGFIKKFGEEFADKIINKEIALGMTKVMLFEIHGVPGEQKKAVFKTKVKETFFYIPRETNRGNIQYELEVLLENDIVVGWKEK